MTTRNFYTIFIITLGGGGTGLPCLIKPRANVTFDYKSNHIEIIQTSSSPLSSWRLSSMAFLWAVIFRHLPQKKKIFFKQEKFAVPIVNAFSKISLRYLSKDTRYKYRITLICPLVPRRMCIFIIYLEYGKNCSGA